MMKKLLSLVVGVILVGATIWFFVFTQAPTTHAITRPTNSGVFAGRLIPAFIGSAYDPASAFEELAGLPVYVMAFDFWDDPTRAAPGESWVISKLAVKTQVRADGSFQVQGLPEASHYGVYFPFALSGNSVVRTDCANSRDNFNGQPGDSNPCKASEETKIWPFRMPRQQDQIVDVFSYAANYLTNEDGSSAAGTNGAVTLDSQVESPPGGGANYQQIRVEHMFVTNRSDLDIANNINTFPVVPSSTLKVKINPNAMDGSGEDSGSQTAGSQYEVWAIRISKRVVTGSGAFAVDMLRQVDFPIVKGRATRTEETSVGSKYTFQAYAPPGNYAVIVWRKEQESPAYNSWDGEQSLRSHQTGWAQIDVGSSNYPSDWRTALSWNDVLTDEIYLQWNEVIVWGTVSDNAGYLLTTKSSAAGDYLWPAAYIGIKSDTETDYSGTDRVTDDRLIPVRDATNAVATNVFAARGMYGVVSSSNSSLPFSDKPWIYLETSGDLSPYSRSPVSPGFVSSFDGPRRVDLVADKSAAGVAGGYDSGVVVRATGATGEVASGARVTFWVANDDDISVPGERKVYYLDRLGSLHIPLSDLTPSATDGSAEGLQYAFWVQLPQAVQFQMVTLGDGFAEVDFELSAAAVKKSNAFNLALLNNAVDLIGQNSNLYKAYAQPADGSLPYLISITLPVSGTVEGPVNIIVNHGGSGMNCEECFISTDEDGLVRYTGDPGDKAVYVHLIAPDNSLTVRGVCETQIGTFLSVLNPLFGGACLLIPELSEIAGQYEIVAQALVDGAIINDSINVSHSENRFSPEGQTLELSKNCATMGAEMTANSPSVWETVTNVATGEGVTAALDLKGQIFGFVAQGACEAGTFLAKHLPEILGMVQKFGLQTRALTQDQPVIMLFDIVRNVVNVLFVIIFVLIGIMTILRYQPEQWHLSILLPKMLKALLMSNFSLLIVQALLDLNNFASFAIFEFTLEIVNNQLTPEGMAVGGATITAALGSAAVVLAAGLIGVVSSAVLTGGLSLIPIVIAVISFVVMFFSQTLTLLIAFFMRYLIIWLAVISAPLVFGLGVLPWFSDYANRWWKVVIGVATMQTIVAGVLSVGVLLLTIGGAGNNSMFSGFEFGIAIVGIMALYSASKVATTQLGSAASAAGMGAFAGALTGSAISGAITGVASGAMKMAQGRMSKTGERRKQHADRTEELVGEAVEKARLTGGNEEDAARTIRIRRGFGRLPFGIGEIIPGAISGGRLDTDLSKRSYDAEKTGLQAKGKQEAQTAFAKSSGFAPDELTKLLQLFEQEGLNNKKVIGLDGEELEDSLGDLRVGADTFNKFIDNINRAFPKGTQEGHNGRKGLTTRTHSIYVMGSGAKNTPRSPQAQPQPPAAQPENQAGNEPETAA